MKVAHYYHGCRAKFTKKLYQFTAMLIEVGAEQKSIAIQQMENNNVINRGYCDAQATHIASLHNKNVIKYNDHV